MNKTEGRVGKQMNLLESVVVFWMIKGRSLKDIIPTAK